MKKVWINKMTKIPQPNTFSFIYLSAPGQAPTTSAKYNIPIIYVIRKFQIKSI